MNRERVLNVAKRVAVWIPVLLLAFIFVPQGWAKFSDSSGWARAFALWHYPIWFRILIGVCETTAALLLVTRRTASIGAAMIAAVMLGGMGTHLYWGHPRQMTSEGLPLALSLVVLFGRWRHLAGWMFRPRDRGDA